MDGCCDGIDCDPETHRGHHTTTEKLAAGLRFAFSELMDDLSIYFLLGILLAGIITVIIPESAMTGQFGSGIWAYLGMLVVSLPLYVCATLSHTYSCRIGAQGYEPRCRAGLAPGRAGYQHGDHHHGGRHTGEKDAGSVYRFDCGLHARPGICHRRDVPRTGNIGRSRCRGVRAGVSPYLAPLAIHCNPGMPHCPFPLAGQDSPLDNAGRQSADSRLMLLLGQLMLRR